MAVEAGLNEATDGDLRVPVAADSAPVRVVREFRGSPAVAAAGPRVHRPVVAAAVAVDEVIVRAPREAVARGRLIALPALLGGAAAQAQVIGPTEADAQAPLRVLGRDRTTDPVVAGVPMTAPVPARMTALVRGRTVLVRMPARLSAGDATTPCGPMIALVPGAQTHARATIVHVAGARARGRATIVLALAMVRVPVRIAPARGVPTVGLMHPAARVPTTGAVLRVLGLSAVGTPVVVSVRAAGPATLVAATIGGVPCRSAAAETAPTSLGPTTVRTSSGATIVRGRGRRLGVLTLAADLIAPLVTARARRGPMGTAVAPVIARVVPGGTGAAPDATTRPLIEDPRAATAASPEIVVPVGAARGMADARRVTDRVRETPAPRGTGTIVAPVVEAMHLVRSASCAARKTRARHCLARIGRSANRFLRALVLASTSRRLRRSTGRTSRAACARSSRAFRRILPTSWRRTWWLPAS